MADLDKLVEELGKLSVLDAAELVKRLESAWGVSAAAPVAMASAAAMANASYALMAASLFPFLVPMPISKISLGSGELAMFIPR